jgi:hypothetical protein
MTVSTAIGHLTSFALTRNSGIVLHAAGLKKGRRCSLFVGPSGAGKSTIAYFAKDAEILHDDRVGIRQIDGKWMAFSIPQIQSTGDIAERRSGKLTNLFLIEKGETLAISSEVGKMDIQRLFRQTVCPMDNWNTQKACSNSVLKLFKDGLVKKLTFKKDSDVSLLI